MRYLKAIFELLRDAGIKWSEDQASILAAGLAYYTVLSLAPLLVFVVAIADRLLRSGNIEQMIISLVTDYAGSEIAGIVENILMNTDQDFSASNIAAILSSLLVVYGASGVFNHLKRALNIVWDGQPEEREGIWSILTTIQARLLAALMVLGIGFLFALSFGLTTILSSLDQLVIIVFPELEGLLPLLHFLASLVMPTLLFAIVFKTLPDVHVAWRDVWLGAVVTALLFALGIQLIGIYLAYSNISSAYGAAGSLLVLLLWLYYSAQIFFYGAEFTEVYANRYGSNIVSVHEAILNDFHESAEPEPEEAESKPARPEPKPAEEPKDAPVIRKRVGYTLLGVAIGLFIAMLRSFRHTWSDM